MKIKEFVEKNKKAVKIAGAVAVVTASGLIGYKIGKRVEVKRFMNVFENKSFKDIVESWCRSGACYSRVLAPDEEVVQFKDLGRLAQEAIDFDASHLNDEIIGMLVMTNPKN